MTTIDKHARRRKRAELACLASRSFAHASTHSIREDAGRTEYALVDFGNQCRLDQRIFLEAQGHEDLLYLDQCIWHSRVLQRLLAWPSNKEDFYFHVDEGSAPPTTFRP